MEPIVTLTLNPTVDGASEAEEVRPTHKIRTSNERYDPGGGGINVARVLRELGADALAVYLAGGATGDVLDALLDARAISRRRVPIRGHTRISFAVYERSTGLEYRFVPEGPTVSMQERDACLAALRATRFSWIVASGSLPPGVPDSFYARVADLAAERGARLVLDTSGPALAAALAHGNVYAVKPSQGEFEALVGRRLDGPDEIGREAMRFVEGGKAEYVAVTLGHDGAVLASAAGVSHLLPPPVTVRSAVGAGDSFLAAMTLALVRGCSAREALAYGIAAGTAAVLTPGTELCKRADVERIYAALSGRDA